MSRRFFSGPSLDRAILQAASHYDVTPDRIAYEVVEKPGMTKRKIVIKVDPDNAVKSAEESAPAVVEAPEPAPAEPVAADDILVAAGETEAEESAEEDESPADDSAAAAAEEPASEETQESDEEPKVAASSDEAEEDEAEEIEEAVEEAAVDEEPAAPAEAPLPPVPSAAPSGNLRPLPSPAAPPEGRAEAEGDEADAARASLGRLFALAGLELESQVSLGDEDRLEIEISGADADMVVEEDGEVLLALQHLLPRVMQSSLGRVVGCRLDCQGFHAVREEKLRDVAIRAAGEVMGQGRPRTLQPMHPADRRIVHLALAEDPGVVTESVGSGYFKRVKVRTA